MIWSNHLIDLTDFFINLATFITLKNETTLKPPHQDVKLGLVEAKVADLTVYQGYVGSSPIRTATERCEWKEDGGVGKLL